MDEKRDQHIKQWMKKVRTGKGGDEGDRNLIYKVEDEFMILHFVRLFRQVFVFLRFARRRRIGRWERERDGDARLALTLAFSRHFCNFWFLFSSFFYSCFVLITITTAALLAYLLAYLHIKSIYIHSFMDHHNHHLNAHYYIIIR